MFGIGWNELLIVLLLALLFFGGAKLPELARSLGTAITEFKDSVKGGEKKEKSDDAKREKNTDQKQE